MTFRSLCRLLVAGAPLLAFGACSGGNSGATSTQAPGSIRVAKSGDETYVTIDQTEQDPVNAACTRYCDRVAACWYARPNNPDLMLTKDEIVGHCRHEQADCRTQTTDMHCCADVTDCYDFNRCVAGARDVEMACERARSLDKK